MRINSMKVKYLGESGPVKLLNGKVYDVVTVNNYGEDYTLVDENGEEHLYDAKDFEIVDVMKGIYHGESDPLGCVDGKVYDIVGYDKEEKECSVIDETGEDYVYDMDSFEIVNE